MTYELYMAMLGFAFITSITPGPNNMMLLASGVNFGLRRTLPHMLGISLGHAFMVFLVGLGIAGVFRMFPSALLALKVVSVIYMLWLAWKIAGSGAPGEGKGHAQPLTFLQAAGFQWVNPKAWTMALGAVTSYVATPSVGAYLALAIGFVGIGSPALFLWAGAGQVLRAWLDDPKRLRIFNWVMAGLLVLSLWPVITMTGKAVTGSLN